MSLTPEQIEARLTMPTNRHGHVVSLFHVPKEQLAAYEAEWRAWLGQNPKRIWPAWVPLWAAHKAKQGKAP